MSRPYPVIVGEVWQNLRSWRLVTVRAIDRALDQVSYRYTTGVIRTLNVNLFLLRHRYESEIHLDANRSANGRYILAFVLGAFVAILVQMALAGTPNVCASLTTLLTGSETAETATAYCLVPVYDTDGNRTGWLSRSIHYPDNYQCGSK